MRGSEVVICYEILHGFESAYFGSDEFVGPFEMARVQDFAEFDGRRFEVFEYRMDRDGTPLPQFGLSEYVRALVAEDVLAPVVREALGQHGAQVAEATIVTQFGRYCAFRAFNLFEDSPQAPVFRVRTSPVDRDLWRRQYYSLEFVEWLKASFDTRGLRISKVECDPYFFRPDAT